MRKTLIAVAALTALTCPAKAEVNHVRAHLPKSPLHAFARVPRIASCAPVDNNARILSTPHPNDIHRDWGGESRIGTSWSANVYRMVRASDGVFYQADLVSPRGGVTDKNVYIIPGEWNCNTPQAASAANRTIVHQSHAQESEAALAQAIKKLGENWQTLSMRGYRLILRCENNTFMAVKLAPGATVRVDLRKTNSALNPYLGIIQIRGKFLRNNSRQDGSCLKTLAEAKQNSNWDDKDEQVASGGTVFTIPSIPSFDYEIYYHINGRELWLMDGNEVFQNSFMRAPGRPEVDPNSPWLRAFRYPIE